MLRLVSGVAVANRKKQTLTDNRPKKGNIVTGAKPIDPKSDPSVKTKKVYLK